MLTKKHIVVLCGGQSVEHDVSLLSASNVLRDLDDTKFYKHAIYITPAGEWRYVDDVPAFILSAKNMHVNASLWDKVLLQPGHQTSVLWNLRSQKTIPVDCFFSMLHGTLGEDGTMQGLFDVLNVPYVGSGCLGSAISMDKDIAKHLFREANIPTLDWLTLHVSQKNKYHYTDIVEKLSHTFFIKTVSSGSSLGVFKIRNEIEFSNALDMAFCLDDYILIEKAVSARELEVSVLGNPSTLRATPPGEVLVFDDFYTYEAKYFNEKGSSTVSPADVSHALSQRLQMLAIQAVEATRCFGMVRVDFLVVSDDEIYLNEVNTIPGFTNISMYPKNWASAGLHYPELLTCLIEAAFLRHLDVKKICANRMRLAQKENEKYSA